jgi:hypothetical protein
MANVRKLTRILDKLVQVGPGYLDQTLRSYITENREYRLYYDKDDQNDPDANTYAVFSYFSSGVYKTEEERETDILIVAGGGGGSVGNISGGSGGGEVIEIRKALLPAGSYVISVGAGGAGGKPIQDNSTMATISVDAIGGIGNDSYFKKNTDPAANTVVATGGGTGGFRKTDVKAENGGSGGGAGGADKDSLNLGSGSGFYEGASTVSDLNLATIMSNDYYGGTVVKYGNQGGDSDAYTLSALSDPDDYYNSGGGGGAGAVGELGNDSKAGNGGDGTTIDWVNEVFSKVYKFNGDIYWGSGGGGAAGESKEPGNGGIGGGGGGASYRQLLAGSPDIDIFWNGKGGVSGYNPGYDASYLKGGAGGQNTGSGAGGSNAIFNDVPAHIHRILSQGPNGGSGFVLIRVSMKDLP